MRDSMRRTLRWVLDRRELRWVLLVRQELRCLLAEREDAVLELLAGTHSRRLLAVGATYYARMRGGDVFRVFSRDGLWVHQGSSGFIVDRAIDTTRTLSQMEASARANWEFLYEPAPGDIVLDIGAGIGDEAYRFSRAVGPTGLVVSIEAHPETYRCLAALCELNHLDNVRPLNLAIADVGGTVMIDDGESHVGNSIIREASGFAVRSVTFGQLLADLGIDHVDYLKMNIEGAERLAMRGVPNGLERVTSLCISCHDFRADIGEGEGFRTKAEVAQVLRRSGFTIIPREDASDPWIRDQLNATRSAPSCLLPVESRPQ